MINSFTRLLITSLMGVLVVIPTPLLAQKTQLRRGRVFTRTGTQEGQPHHSEKEEREY